MVRRTEAEIRKAYIDAINFIKLETARETPVVLNSSAIAKQFNVRSELLIILTDLELLKLEKKGKENSYCWIASPELKIDAKLADKVYELVGRRVYNRTKGDATKPKLPSEKDKEAQDAKKSKVKKVKEVEKKKAIKDYQGTLFKLDQLTFMSKMEFKKPTTVQLNEKQLIPDIHEMAFDVKGTQLTVKFFKLIPTEKTTVDSHSIEDVTIEVYSQEFVNCGLALRYGFEDTKSKTLVVESVEL